MEFDDLPVELLVKIFSYLPQHSLLTAARVSCRWNQVALDPSLWTEFKVDSTVGTGTIRLILIRATKLRKLDIAGSVTDVEAIALALPRLQALKELAIDKGVLASDIMLSTLGHCESLTTVVITGKSPLCENDVAVLRNLPWLTSVVVSGKLVVSNCAVHQICSACPLLENLKLSAYHYLEDLHRYLKNLQHLRSLSLARVCTSDLLPLCNSCPNLECLEILALDAFVEPRAKAFDKFLKLKRLTVHAIKAHEPFSSSFRAPPSLEWLSVPELETGKAELQLLVQSCKASLRHLAINACKVPHSATEILSACENLESVRLHGLSGSIVTLPTLWKFSKLVHVTLTVDQYPAGMIYQLLDIVDVLDTSCKGRTRLILDMFCYSPISKDVMTRAVTIFKDFLASKTLLSKEHIRDMEEQYLNDRKPFQRVVSTSFPVRVKTLKFLKLKLRAF